jgi:hypothetical protein
MNIVDESVILRREVSLIALAGMYAFAPGRQPRMAVHIVGIRRIDESDAREPGQPLGDISGALSTTFVQLWRIESEW